MKKIMRIYTVSQGEPLGVLPIILGLLIDSLLVLNPKFNPNQTDYYPLSEPVVARNLWAVHLRDQKPNCTCLNMFQPQKTFL